VPAFSSISVMFERARSFRKQIGRKPEGKKPSRGLIFTPRWTCCVIVKFWFNIWESTVGRYFHVYNGDGSIQTMKYNLKFCYQLSICSRTTKTTETLDRVGRSQNLPDTNLLLTISLALIIRSITIFHIWLFPYFNSLHICFTESFVRVHVSFSLLPSQILVSELSLPWYARSWCLNATASMAMSKFHQTGPPRNNTNHPVSSLPYVCLNIGRAMDNEQKVN
jgi:hypothetical protein